MGPKINMMESEKILTFHVHLNKAPVVFAEVSAGFGWPSGPHEFECLVYFRHHRLAGDFSETETGFCGTHSPSLHFSLLLPRLTKHTILA
jgi:hypothetical protein